MRIQFNLTYFLLFVLLFIIEVMIALYVHDDFIRPFFGDFLVVILIYCFVKAFMNVPVFKAAFGVLVFSFVVEFLQYFHFIKIIGLEDNKLARIVLGTSFSWWDLVFYVLGIGFILLVERLRNQLNKKS